MAWFVPGYFRELWINQNPLCAEIFVKLTDEIDPSGSLQCSTKHFRKSDRFKQLSQQTLFVVDEYKRRGFHAAREVIRGRISTALLHCMINGEQLYGDKFEENSETLGLMTSVKLICELTFGYIPTLCNGPVRLPADKAAAKAQEKRDQTIFEMLRYTQHLAGLGQNNAFMRGACGAFKHYGIAYQYPKLRDMNEADAVTRLAQWDVVEGQAA